MHFDQQPDRPVPPYGNPRSGGSGPRPGNPGPGYRGPDRPWPNEQEPYNPRDDRLRPNGQRPESARPNRPRVDDPGPYRPRPSRPRPGAQEPYNRAPSPPWPDAQEPYNPGPNRPWPDAQEPSRPRSGDSPGPRSADPRDPWSASRDPWSAEPAGSVVHRVAGSVVRRARGIPGPPSRGTGPRRRPAVRELPARPPKPRLRQARRFRKRGGSMRTAVMVSGILGVVLVFAVGLVALAVARGSSNGTAASAGHPGLERDQGLAPRPRLRPRLAKAKASRPRPRLRATAKKTAAAGSTKAAAPALLTVPAGWKLDVRSQLLRLATEHRHVVHLLRLGDESECRLHQQSRPLKKSGTSPRRST